MKTYSCQFLAFFIITSLLFSKAGAQSKLGVEQYSYIQRPGDAVFVPIMHLETKKNWYMELRYNYEDRETLSIFGGKAFNGGKALEYTITPMIGWSGGLFSGISFATNTDIEWKNFCLSAQSQYSLATKTNAANFFFNWSEFTYDITDNIFAGLAMQYTREQSGSLFEPGIMAGFSLKNFSVPVYAFNVFGKDRYFVFGVNFQYDLKKRK